MKPNIKEFQAYFKNHNRHQMALHYGVSISAIDRWCRSFNLPRKSFRHRDIQTNFTEKQIEIICGSLLGDGSLSVVNKFHMKNSCYIETHSIKQHGLLDWKREQLEPFSCPIKIKETNGRKLDENRKVIDDPEHKLTTCFFKTITHPVFTELERKWYSRNSVGEYTLTRGRRTKIVPQDLILTPTVVAVWYFDDGSNNVKNRTITFNTHAFSKHDCEELKNKLQLLGIKCSVVKNRDSLVIQVKCASYLDLINMVKEKLPHACMAYKVDLSQYKPPDYSTRFQKRP